MANSRPRADIAFVRGKVFTGTSEAPVEAAVAVLDGVITAVAGEAEVRALADEGTEVVDLKGGLLVPGFQDAHVHPVVAGVQLGRCDLSGERVPGPVAVAGFPAHHRGDDRPGAAAARLRRGHRPRRAHP